MVTLLITLCLAIERLLSRVIVALKALSVIMSQLESAFADNKGGLSEFLTSSVVSAEGSSPTPLDKGAKGTGHGVSP